jgi:hypothetical protein
MGFDAIFNRFSSNIIQTNVEMLLEYFFIITSPLLTINVSTMVTSRVSSPIA